MASRRSNSLKEILIQSKVNRQSPCTMQNSNCKCFREVTTGSEFQSSETSFSQCPGRTKNSIYLFYLWNMQLIYKYSLFENSNNWSYFKLGRYNQGSAKEILDKSTLYPWTRCLNELDSKDIRNPKDKTFLLLSR